MNTSVSVNKDDERSIRTCGGTTSALRLSIVSRRDGGRLSWLGAGCDESQGDDGGSEREESNFLWVAYKCAPLIAMETLLI